MEFTTKGNLKITRDTIIFNITSARDCTSCAMGLCQVPNGRCYALKSERLHPKVLPYRRRQTEAWDNQDAPSIAAEINDIVNRSRRPRRWVRVQESGDFRSQEDVDKLSAIAAETVVPMFTYTARCDLDFSGVHENLTINGSGFMVHNEFRLVEHPGRIHCQGSCAACHICKLRRGVTIDIGLH